MKLPAVRVPRLPPIGPGSGAIGPFGDWVGHHSRVAVDGYFWRFTDRASGRTALALLGVNRGRDGREWGTVALATGPDRVVRSAVAGEAMATARGLDIRAWEGGHTLLRGTEDAVEVDLGPDAQLHVRFRDAVRWPADAMWGGVGPAHAVPGLSQYWHPHLLTARVEGEVRLGDGPAWTLRDAVAYGEKNWGAGGFPPAWWWGQAHGFADPGTLVCFAGGRAGVGPLRTTATSLVVRLPGGDLGRFVRPLQWVSIDHGERSLRLRARTPGWRVDVEVETEGPAHDLPVPVPLERRNEDTAHQHQSARFSVVVRRGSRVVLRDESTLGAFERGTSG